MKTETAIDRNATAAVIDSISRDSAANDSPAVVAQALRLLYSETAIRVAIAELAEDADWSQDAEPYNWLADINAAL